VKCLLQLSSDRVVNSALKSTLERDGEQVLNYDQYLLHLISTFSNRAKALSSSQYLSEFGLGSVEMRVIASLAYRPEQKAAQVCELISIDKGAASRAFNRLAQEGLIHSNTPEGKQKLWSLTPSGWELHRRFLKLVLAREQRLIAGICEADLVIFHRTLMALTSNLSELEQTLAVEKK